MQASSSMYSHSYFCFICTSGQLVYVLSTHVPSMQWSPLTGMVVFNWNYVRSKVCRIQLTSAKPNAVGLP